MNKNLRLFFSGLLLVVGLGLFYLTNKGVLSFEKAAIFQISSKLPAENPPVAIAQVNLVPMDKERIIKNQTIIVRDGLIETIGDSDQVNIPENAVIVDGKGKYLMPGLIDMHVHIESENDMLLFVANGVTSVRNMWGNTGKKLQVGLPDQLQLRQQIEQGTLLGPTIYTTGPIMEGRPSFHPLAEVFTTPEEAVQSITWQKAQGYDFIKVYDNLSPEVYAAIIAAGVENNMPVVGHVPFAVGLENVLNSSQQTIEHLAGYIDSDAVEFLIAEDQLHEYAQKTRQAGVWNVVTLTVYPTSKETPAGMERLKKQPAMAYISPGMRLMTPFLYKMTANAHTYKGEDYAQRIAGLNRRMVQALHEEGAGILLGTDSAQFYHIPGFSIHEELALLVDAGLTPYEALEAGTRNAALVLGKVDSFGTLTAGKRADMILLEANPLEDVRNVQKRAGVMLRGQWFSEEELQSLLNGLVKSYRPTLFDRLWPLLIVIGALAIIMRTIRKSSQTS